MIARRAARRAAHGAWEIACATSPVWSMLFVLLFLHFVGEWGLLLGFVALAAAASK